MTPTKVLVGQVLIVFAIVIATLWFATEWAAAELGHQRQLGTPWFSVLSDPLYYPGRLFEWWCAFDACRPSVFNEAGAIAAGGGILGITAAIGSLWRARQNRPVTTYGSSRRANRHEVEQADLFQSEGVFLGELGKDHLRHDGPEHVMAFAPTRSGKGVGLVIPTLLTWAQSAVVHDITGENWQLTAGWRTRFSHYLLFNPTDPRSARYNPLLEALTGPDEIRDKRNIADILVDAASVLERRNHWEKTGHSLLVGTIHIAGDANTGKTILARTLLQIAAETGDRLVVRENRREILLPHSNIVALRAKDGVASLSGLVRSAFLLSPDRIPVGEVRGNEAIDLLDAWSAGQAGGVATMQAKSTVGALYRFEQLCLRTTTDWPRELIAQTVDAVVLITVRNGRRSIQEIIDVLRLDERGAYRRAPVLLSSVLTISKENS
ncbi:MAG: conjugal transfer protein TraG [Rhodospirillales bacterium]|nr:conjugal transfer protein TraG [Rhodospirillales bacterium]